MIITREAREANDTSIWASMGNDTSLETIWFKALNSHHILTHKHLSMASSQLALLSP